jgi:nitric oxide reductase NorD protein
MYLSSRRQARALRAELSRNLSMYFFENRDFNSMLYDIDSLGRTTTRKALAFCVALSNYSGNIVPKVIEDIKVASRTLSEDELERWIDEAFDLLDSQGLEQTKRFLDHTDAGSLGAFLAPNELALDTVSSRLTIFLRSLSGRDMHVTASPDGRAYTDTQAVLLPAAVSMFREQDENLLFCKLMVSHLWAQTELGTFHIGGNEGAFERFFSSFENQPLAVDLYRVLEAVRVRSFLLERLPGLMRDVASLKMRLLGTMQVPSETETRGAFVDGLFREFLEERSRHPLLVSNSGLADPSAKSLTSLYEEAMSLPGHYKRRDVLFPCSIVPEAVSAAHRKRMETLSKRIEGLVDRLVDMPEEQFDRLMEESHKVEGKQVTKPDRKYLLVRGQLMELDEDMEEALEEGGLPEGMLVDGSSVQGGSATPLGLKILLDEGLADITVEEGAGGIRYDEWDYKRSGYKKDWCTLYERDVHPMDDPFVEETLIKYGGYVSSLRKKFELLRDATRLNKRQRDGDDVDIDAAVEAFADLRSDLAPSDGLYTLLHRDERDIATLFLLDMSGSTKGWVNVAEKEALVLMCEALEALRDRYAIYGFSGMTRTRCDFYRIKMFDEPYGLEVKRRIAGILPKDYTRMGVAIRHATSIISRVEAQTRLIITLSDGRPEDYDAYKGTHGIEDTRKSLIEADQKGIHSFCITIDREAHDYLPYLYGETRYTFIDDVRKLPAKMTDIYTRLTT